MNSYMSMEPEGLGVNMFFTSRVVGCDEEHLLTYSEFRAAEQRPTEATKRFVDYVSSEKQIKAVLAGHLHFSFESRLPGGMMQYVTNRGDQGMAREITIL